MLPQPSTIWMTFWNARQWVNGPAKPIRLEPRLRRRRARLAALPGGGELADIPQAQIQRFCWYELPSKWMVAPPERWWIIECLADLLEQAGRHRVAKVITPPESAAVPTAWTTAGFGCSVVRSESTCGRIWRDLETAAWFRDGPNLQLCRSPNSVDGLFVVAGQVRSAKSCHW